MLHYMRRRMKDVRESHNAAAAVRKAVTVTGGDSLRRWPSPPHPNRRTRARVARAGEKCCEFGVRPGRPAGPLAVWHGPVGAPLLLRAGVEGESAAWLSHFLQNVCNFNF